MKLRPSPPKKYLLVAAMPTPNGALHLGHVGAQYLPLDVFKRYQQQQGNAVAYYGGFDVFDNAVCVKAQHRDTTPHALAKLFADQIRAELAYLEVDLDCLINYDEAPYKAKAKQIVSKLEEALGDRLISCKTDFPFDNTGRPVSGNWLRGSCSYCEVPVKGYSCDACGRSLLPTELSCASTLDGSTVAWRSVNVSFVAAAAAQVTDYVRSLPAAQPYMHLVRDRLLSDELRLQWTSIDTWGLPLRGNTVFFNRNFTFIEQLLVGDLACDVLNVKSNAFAPDSRVISILAYGKDNAPLLLADIPAMAMATRYYRPYKIQWISPFYNLNGRKMSTSRNDAIWVSDAIANGIDAEAIRFYLCRKFELEHDVELSLRELELQQLEVNALRSLIQSMLDLPDGPRRRSIDLETRLDRLRAKVAVAIKDQAADISAFPRVIDAWMEAPDRCAFPRQWLHGLAELAAPLLPRMAGVIAARLGQPSCASHAGSYGARSP